MLVLGIVMKLEGTYIPVVNDAVADTREGVSKFLHGLGEHILDVLIALAPIIVFALLFQLMTRAFNKNQIIRMAIGIVYVLVGLAIFLTGATVFHTKSINNERAEQSIGTSINRETDSILFLTTLEYKTKIMDAVRDVAGLKFVT